MIKFSIIYDSKNKTWNVMIGGKCEFYGTAEQCDEWALRNSLTHVEV